MHDMAAGSGAARTLYNTNIEAAAREMLQQRPSNTDDQSLNTLAAVSNAQKTGSHPRDGQSHPYPARDIFLPRSQTRCCLHDSNVSGTYFGTYFAVISKVGFIFIGE